MQVLFSCLHTICRFCYSCLHVICRFPLAVCTRSAGSVQLSIQDLQVLFQLYAHDLQVPFSCLHTIYRFCSAVCTRSADSVNSCLHVICRVRLAVYIRSAGSVQLSAHDLQVFFSCLHTVVNTCWLLCPSFTNAPVLFSVLKLKLDLQTAQYPATATE